MVKFRPVLNIGRSPPGLLHGKYKRPISPDLSVHRGKDLKAVRFFFPWEKKKKKMIKKEFILS